MEPINIGVLTSSRADYGIYKPLLKLLSEDDRVSLSIIAFGSHLLSKYGETIHVIEREALGQILKVEGMGEEDSPSAIVTYYGKLVLQFNKLFESHQFDIVFALGDRYEMSAAVQATIPHELKIAHIHGGETTLGAIDNVYRHQITIASKWHFVTTQFFKERVVSLIESDEFVYNVGALSLSEIAKNPLPDWFEVSKKFSIPQKPFILSTFHPETVKSKNNSIHAQEVMLALNEVLMYTNIVITGTNADTSGTTFRNMALDLKERFPEKVYLVESFGKENYFAALSNCLFVLGNSSSGIIEAASFGKFVLNVGNRQKGRKSSDNVIDIPFKKEVLIKAMMDLLKGPSFDGENVYYKPDTANAIKETILSWTGRPE